TVSLVLIIATLTVYRQISFMHKQDLGFNSNQMLIIKAPLVRESEYGPTFNAFKETLLQRADISGISHVTEVPGRQIYWDAGGILKAGGDADQSKNYQIVGVDYEFAKLFDLEFVAGRNFLPDFPSDTNGLIFNETAVRWIGFENADSAVGQNVNYWGEIYPIIGVLKDFHQQSPKIDYEPHIYRYMPYGRGAMGAIALKINTSDIKGLIFDLNKQYDNFFPGNSFDYFFLDEYFNQQYNSEQLFGKIFILFSLLAIIITSLGIFGLSLYSTSQRTKEIGIRKVMGASTTNILKMLISDSIKLIIIANLIAWPIAFYAMNRWLEGFANRTNIGIWTFVISGLIIILTTILTVSYQSYRAASANPVNSIQQE
ncbi:MAG: FtsX-like permease family protein, partial [Candidatus Zixiibacteriota bacterium]